jgi:hypothetical protein
VKNCRGFRQRRHHPPVTYRLSTVTLLLLAGCSVQSVQTFYEPSGGPSETNYMTFQHAFTDAGADEARRRAESQCGQKKMVAVESRSTCSLERCITSYQCMTPSDAAQYQSGGQRK